MGPDPIKPTELAEMARQLAFPLRPWVAQLIYRMDDAVMLVWAKERNAQGGDASEAEESVPVNDVKGLKAMLRGVAARTAATKRGR